MKNSKCLIVFTVFLIMFIGLFLNIKSGFFNKTSSAQVTVASTPRRVFWGGANPLPPEITYRFLFEQIALLDEEDKKPQKPGTTFKTSFYEDRLGLKPSQFAALDAIVSQYLEKARPLDARAKQIINEFRAQFPNGELPEPTPTPESASKKVSTVRFTQPFGQLPSPPAELIELQARKNKIVLEFKDKLKQSLGEAEFSKFEEALKKDADSMVVPENPHKIEQLQLVLGN